MNLKLLRHIAFLLLLSSGGFVNAQIPLAALLDTSDMAADLDEALTFNKYPTYGQYIEMMQKFASDYPDICRLDTFGYSNLGRMLLALKISDNAQYSETEPRFFYSSSIHGDELSGYVHMLRLADFLLANYGLNSEVTGLVNDVEVWINPLFNPDGAYRNDDLTLYGAVRGNYFGRDLNRNFPDVPDGERDDTTGRETETIYMMEFLKAHKFNLSANIHSGAEVVNYPWDNGPNDRTWNTYEKHPDDDWWIFISREYADEAHAVNPLYMDEFTDGISNGSDWYRIKGGRQDYVTFFLEGRELTLELSNPKNEPSETLETLWNYNKWSLFNLVSQSRYGIHGTITSAESGIPLKAKVEILDYDSTYARIETNPGQFNWLRTDTINLDEYPGAETRGSWVTTDSSTGFFIRYLKEGVYSLVISSEGYFNDTIQDVSVTDYTTTLLGIELDTAGVIGNLPGLEQLQGITLYPNPAGDYINIRLANPDKAINAVKIISIDGKFLLQKRIGYTGPLFTIDVSQIPNGLYLLGIQLNDTVIYRTIIIE